MDEDKKKRLEKAGWSVGDTSDLLGVSSEDKERDDAVREAARMSHEKWKKSILGHVYGIVLGDGIENTNELLKKYKLEIKILDK